MSSLTQNTSMDTPFMNAALLAASWSFIECVLRAAASSNLVGQKQQAYSLPELLFIGVAFEESSIALVF